MTTFKTRANSHAAESSSNDAALAAPASARPLSEPHAALREIYQQGDAWLWRTDVSGRVVWLSDDYRAVARRAPEELLGAHLIDHIREEALADANLCPQRLERVESALRRGSGFRDFSYAARDEDGAACLLRMTATPEQDATGALIGHVGVARRISDLFAARRESDRVEQELSDALDSASLRFRAAENAKSVFLANVSHELRTPLNAILGFCDVLRSESLGEIGRRNLECVGYIETAGAHLRDMIVDLLDLAKIDAGEIRLVEETFEFGECLEACLREAQSEAERLNVAIEIDEAAPLLVEADDVKLKQAMLRVACAVIRRTGADERVVIRSRGARDGGLEIEIGASDTPRWGRGATMAGWRSIGSLSGEISRDALGLRLAAGLFALHDGAFSFFEPSSGPGFVCRLALPADRIRGAARPPLADAASG